MRNGKCELVLEQWLKALAPLTRRVYRTWMDRYLQWCATTGRDPECDESVTAYINSLVEQGYGVSAAHQAAAALKLWLRSRGADLEDPNLSQLLRDLRIRLGALPRQAKRPFTLEMLTRVRWRSGITGARDKALLLTGFFGALRIRELVGLNIEDVTSQREGCLLVARHPGAPNRYRLVAIPRGGRLCPAEAIEYWLDVLRQHGYTSGPLFRQVQRGRLYPGRIPVQTAQNIIKYYAAQLGYDPREFSGHSLRAGFIASAALRNAPEVAIALQTGHRDLEMLRDYLERTTLRAIIWERSAARWLV